MPQSFRATWAITAADAGAVDYTSEERAVRDNHNAQWWRLT